MGKNQHVVPRGNRWAVVGEGNGRASSIHDRQSDAAEAARSTAIREGSEVLVHGRNGQIRERNTYGKDPHPPRG